ncbi:MAG TPA: chemotaxis-specific protein-glutamate methyltransferase CheB [Gemmatimonadaceae bacterium]|nr:chemotaxis-specific protein-glutamate methyltransferase CheB [Gemmatimonadaceae bacterium]
MPQTTKRVLVVDDSAFMRGLVTEIVEFRDDFRVVGTACDGIEALEQVRVLQPDIVTLDIAMPRMDGLAALERIMSETPRPVIVVSAADSADFYSSAVTALELGAVEFVRKPSGPVSVDLVSVRADLMRALDMASMVRFGPRLPQVTKEPVQSRDVAPARQRPAGRIVVVAASTGGPRALAAMASRLPANLEAAIVVVQHMPAVFVPTLAERLQRICVLPVTVAEDGDQLFEGHVYVAPGEGQARLRHGNEGPVVRIDADDALCAARPSADPLFRSAAEVFGRRSVGVVLSGMGRDGAEGLRAIRGAGGGAIVQNRSTSIIYGMPAAALATAGADSNVPADEIANAITALVSRRRRVA